MTKSNSTFPRVLITGASRGIGLALARQLAAGGYEVTGTSRQPERLRAELPEISAVALDLNRAESIDECIRQVGPVDILVNNAGESRIAPAEIDPPDQVQTMFETHLYGPVRLIQGFLPSMRENRNGWIVNIGSLAGTFAVPFQSAYSAAKSALEAYTQALRNEVWGLGIRVVLVNPNDIRTTLEPEVMRGAVSEYHARLERMQAVRSARMAAADAPEKVARTIGRLLRKRHPAPVYTVGGAGPLMMFARRWLPNRVIERLVRQTYRI